MAKPYGWRRNQSWESGYLQNWDNSLKVSKGIMEKFLEKFSDEDGEKVRLTDLGLTCARLIFGANKDKPLLMSNRGPNDYSIHQTHNGKTRLFTLQLFSDSGMFEPRFFGEDMLKCAEGEKDMQNARALGDIQGLDPLMVKSVFGKFLQYQTPTGGRKKRRSTRRKHTLVKRRNVRVNRFRTLKA
jgi:hypothetical protein